MMGKADLEVLIVFDNKTNILHLYIKIPKRCISLETGKR